MLFSNVSATLSLPHTHSVRPNPTPLLCQVSFYLFIPAMLFSKVSATLSTQPSGPLLAAIVGATLAQILLGAFFGKALAPLVDGQYSRDRTILGWHPLNPARWGGRAGGGSGLCVLGLRPTRRGGTRRGVRFAPAVLARQVQSNGCRRAEEAPWRSQFCVMLLCIAGRLPP